MTQRASPAGGHLENRTLQACFAQASMMDSSRR